MLQRRESSVAEETSINVVPMVDIMLVLVIFFVVTTSFVDDMNLDIDRPTAKSATPSETQAIRLFIDSSGDTYLDGAPVQVWMIQTQLDLLLEASTSDSVLVVTDDSVPAKRLIEVVDQARLAGAQVGVATSAESGGG
ncbi:MAG: ExbD/TolR family protein [Gammaproteobacteria bacterium]|nr:biopolymer transporter ExbD [Gammaproteobacteria bacterium]